MFQALKRLPKSYKIQAFLVLGVLVVYALSLVITHYKTQGLANLLEEQILEQQSLLREVAVYTSRNGVDNQTKTIVQDCSVSERTEFDRLLGSLDSGLSNSDLQKLDTLFGRCGAFFAEQRLIASGRLEREVEVFEQYVRQLEIVRGNSVYEKYNVDTWKQLVAEEEKQSELFMKLVTLQDNIITVLLDGKTTESEEIKKILREVGETRSMLAVANEQAATTRTQVMSQ